MLSLRLAIVFPNMPETEMKSIAHNLESELQNLFSGQHIAKELEREKCCLIIYGL